MDPTGAGIITVVRTAYALALHIKWLVERINRHDEIALELAEKLDTLTAILREAGTLCGQDGSDAHRPREQHLRQAISKIIVRCQSDLERYDARLRRLVGQGNWASLAWRHEVAAPELANIDKSLSERLHHLQILLQLLQRLVAII
ncbi:MAG: hypothetical protein Q9218_005087 [Villophora microphyllina]